MSRRRRKMNKQELEELVAVLKSAKKYLKDGKEVNSTKTSFICFAIADARAHAYNAALRARQHDDWSEPFIDESPYQNAKNLISRGINRSRYFHHWLWRHNRHLMVNGKPAILSGVKNLQRFRHKWLDQLIRDYTKMAKEAIV